jgi:hypothetical protein
MVRSEEPGSLARHDAGRRSPGEHRSQCPPPFETELAIHPLRKSLVESLNPIDQRIDAHQHAEMNV